MDPKADDNHIKFARRRCGGRLSLLTALLLPLIWSGMELNAEASYQQTNARNDRGLVLELKEDTPVGQFIEESKLTRDEKKRGVKFVLRKTEILKAGTTVEIPPEYVVDRYGEKSGTPDAGKSLSNWFGKAIGEGRADDVRFGQARLKGEGAFSQRNYGGATAYEGSFFYAVKKPDFVVNGDLRIQYLPLQDLYRKNLLKIKNLNGRELESQYCPTCVRLTEPGELERIARRFVPLAEDEAAERAPRVKNPTTTRASKIEVNGKIKTVQVPDQLNKKCDMLMDSSGRIGDWGRTLLSTMNSPPYEDEFHKPNALGQDFCPNFSRMTKHEQSHAWLWFWTVLGSKESGCNQNIHHRMIDDKGRKINPTFGTGIWAFEKFGTKRKWRWESARKAGRKPACKYVNTIADQSLCAVDTMYRQLNSFGSADYHRTGMKLNPYWGPIKDHYTLRDRKGNRTVFGRQKQLVPQMKRFPGCFSSED